ncbi:MAG: glycosyltransferase family 4 protein [Candidatus Riflebacteria bacterium]|nr:glycosyltransferase family 4 protein [Candidatus Riflebacteria bacterium]
MTRLAPLCVAVDARTATGAFTGIGRYTVSLVESLVREAPDLALHLWVTDPAVPLFSSIVGAGASLHPTSMEVPRHPLSDVWLHACLPVQLARRRIPVLFSCANYLPVLSGGARRVVTIHDLVCFRHPEVDPWTFVVFLKSMLRLAVRCADRIIAVSQATADELTSILGVSPERITVVHNGVGSLFRQLDRPDRERRRLPDGVALPFVLSVGAHIPRKNFGRLVAAWATLRRRGFPHQLVLAGPPGISDPELGRLVAESKLDGVVRFVGYPSDDELLTLYNQAAAFVYPSIYEGFGIPVVEAMACGTPVACSRTSSVPEVAGDAAAYFDPLSVPEIVDTVERLLSDRQLADGLVRAGLDRAARFTWAAAARKTAEVLRAVAR